MLAQEKIISSFSGFSFSEVITSFLRNACSCYQLLDLLLLFVLFCCWISSFSLQSQVRELLNCSLVAKHSSFLANFLVNTPDLPPASLTLIFTGINNNKPFLDPQDMGKETCSLLPCRRTREGMVPPTAPFYLASADLFSSGRDELVAHCRSEDCGLEMHLTHLPDAVGYNAECCPVWSFILTIPGLNWPHRPPLREGHTASSRGRNRPRFGIQNADSPISTLLSHHCESHLLAPAWPCRKSSFSEARPCKVKSPSYSWAPACWTCLGSLVPSFMRNTNIHSV